MSAPAGDRELDVELEHHPARRAGVWATQVEIAHTEHGFTIDFIRVDPFAPTQGALVARVAMSPLLVSRLLESLGREWRWHAQKAMPKEVRDDRSAEHGT